MADISPFAGLRYAADRVGDARERSVPALRRHRRRRTRPSWKRGTPRTSCGWSFRAAPTTRATRRRRGCSRRGRRRASCAPTRARRSTSTSSSSATAGQRYTRRGFFAAVRLEPFERRVVLPHEKTLSAPKEDRRRLLRATRTQISPVFGLYRDAERRGARHHRRGRGGRARGRRDDHRRRSPPPVADHLGRGARRPADAARRQADPDRRRPPPLRDDARAGARDAAAGRRGGRGGVGLRDDVPGARRGSGPAGVADAPAGEGPRRTSASTACARRPAAAFDISQGDETTAAAIEARLARDGRQARRVRGARARPAVHGVARAEADPGPVGARAAHAAQPRRHRAPRRHPGPAAGDRRRGAGEAVVPDLHARHRRGAGPGGRRARSRRRSS